MKNSMAGPPGSYTSTQGMARYYGCTANSNVFLRGGAWGNGSNAGVFALDLGTSPTYVGDYIGFRCAR